MALSTLRIRKDVEKIVNSKKLDGCVERVFDSMFPGLSPLVKAVAGDEIANLFASKRLVDVLRRFYGESANIIFSMLERRVAECCKESFLAM